MNGLSTLLFWTTIAFLCLGFALLPFWNALYVVMASLLGSLWVVSHQTDHVLEHGREAVSPHLRRALDRCVEGVREAHEMGNVYFRNIFYTVALTILTEFPVKNPSEFLSNLYEAKYDEPLPVPSRNEHIKEPTE